MKKLKLSRKTIKALSATQEALAHGAQSQNADGCWGANTQQTCYGGCSQYCVGTYYCQTYLCTPPVGPPPSWGVCAP